MKFGRITVKSDVAKGFGLTTSITYVRLRVKDDAEFWRAGERIIGELRQRAMKPVFEEVPYAEGMGHILADLMQWPKWEEAVKNGDLNYFDNILD